MGCKINALSISKLLSSLTEYFDSKYRGRLYNITNFQVQAGCKELDNFLSSIHKVQLTTKVFTVGSESRNGAEIDGVGENTEIRKCSEEHQFNLICKSTILEDDGNRDNLEKYYWSILFTKEKSCYDFLENLAQELGEVSPLCPKMHHCYSEGEEYSCLILEDVQVSMGYSNPLDQDEGISLQECNLIIKSLARLHALSLVLEGKQGCTLPTKYEICTTELLFSAGVEPALKPLTYNSFLGFLKLTSNFRPDLLPYLKRIDDDENIWNRLVNLVKPGQTAFSCLCHGDPRSSNIFLGKSTSQKPSCRENNGESSNRHDYHHHDGSNFKLEEKNAENGMSVNGGESQNQSPLLQEPGLRFIDFQLTRYASPVTDLQYVLHMNTTRDFREKHTMEVLRTYYAEFQDVLGRFPHVILEQSEGVRGWTFEKLTEEYEKFYMYGFLASVILLPIVLLRSVDMDIDKSMSQMTKAERTQFFKDGRADLVFNAGSRNDIMRKRLFEMCDEMVAKNVIPTNAPA